MSLSKLKTAFLSSETLKANEKKLTPLEAKYWKLMKARSGVPYLRGPVGTAKSAIAKTIAEKLEMNFIDLRLGSADETDLGAFPKEMTDASGVSYVEHLSTRWAVESNKRPTIIAIEELNRTRKAVQDAALQVLNERIVGNLQLNENVFMIASGNLGEEDGTEVNEVDAATNNRLIHIKHHLKLADWIDGYAKENVLPDIVEFISNHASVVGEIPKYDTKDVLSGAFGTYRSWTNLSNFCEINEVDLYDENDILLVAEVAASIVGSSASLKFKKFLQERKAINLTMILKSFDKYENQIRQLNRVQRSSLLDELRSSVDIYKIKDSEYQNVLKFLCTIDQDELAGTLYKIGTDVPFKYIHEKNPRLREITATHPILSVTFEKMRASVNKK